MIIYYIYPMWHKVSFTLIAKHHIRELRKYYQVYEIDELAVRHLNPYCRPITLLHPCFFIMSRFAGRLERIRSKLRSLIGLDVADSDRISNLAVSMTHYCDAMIVPSTWSREAYIKSGVKCPVYVVPHGLTDDYFQSPKPVQYFRELASLKREKNYIYLLHFCWHSEYRKGLDLVFRVYEQLRRERKDIVLVLKFMTGYGTWHHKFRELGGIIIAGWLKDDQIIELYDLCDIYLLFSRGGGFELNGLEALARGEVVIAADRGSWTDYLPPFSLVRSHECPYVLKDNPIHSGKGVEIDTEKAVDKICEIANDLEEYKARVRDYVNKYIKPRFAWSAVARRLAGVIAEISKT